MKEIFLEKRKGQAELFGLTIIVVLLIFALLFFVKLKEKDTSNVTLRNSFRANNLLNAIMNVNIDTGENLKDLLKDCLDTGVFSSTECVKSQQILMEIFQKTLLESEKYELKGSKGLNEVLKLPQITDCFDGITASPTRLPEGYVFELKLCPK